LNQGSVRNFGTSYYGSFFSEGSNMVMVPVLDSNNQPLMPCRPARAKELMRKEDAKPYYQKGIFCIKLLREPSGRVCQPIALGIDPGSKREGYTAITEKAVVLNITTNTPDWVKEHIETRRNLRRSRRQRKTPYRACRENRATLRKSDRIPPSTKARWDAKLRIIKLLMRILPITAVNVENIAATTKEGKTKWNSSFSPLEVGKAWFYSEIKKLAVQLITTEGFDTAKHRATRGFDKSRDKLDYIWEAHNVDSHSLAEIALNTMVLPDKGLWKIQFHQQHRRQIQKQNPAKGNIRKLYGTTISLGLPRCSVARYKGKLIYIGGTSKGRISIHSIISGYRLSQNAKKEDIMLLHTASWRTQFISETKIWSSLHGFWTNNIKERHSSLA
jgi:hypothetical protein